MLIWIRASLQNSNFRYELYEFVNSGTTVQKLIISPRAWVSNDKYHTDYEYVANFRIKFLLLIWLNTMHLSSIPEIILKRFKPTVNTLSLIVWNALSKRDVCRSRPKRSPREPGIAVLWYCNNLGENKGPEHLVERTTCYYTTAPQLRPTEGHTKQIESYHFLLLQIY